MGNILEDWVEISTWDPFLDERGWSPSISRSLFLEPEMPDTNQAIEVGREGSEQPLPIIYGRRKVGGIIVHKYVTGDDNEFLNYIVAFCHGPVSSVERLFFNDIPDNDSQWSGYVSIQTRTGEVGQPHIAAAVDGIPNWNTSMVGNNVCYAWVRLLQVKEESVWRGEPEITAIIQGREVYDWRTDTTEFSKNPAVCAVDYLTNPVFGRGLDISQLNLPQWTAAADFCDETTESEVEKNVQTVNYNPPAYRPSVSWTTETVTESHPRYELDAVIDTSKNVFNNYKELLAAFRGVPNRTNGIIGVSIETVGTPLLTFTDADLTGAVEISTTGQNNRYNRVVVKFPDKNSDNYERNEAVYPKPGAQLYEDWLAEDNNKPLEGEFEFNTFSEQSDAEQMAEIIAKRSRIDQNVAFRARGLSRLVVPNDIIGLTVEAYGWDNQPVRVISRREAEDGVFEFEAVRHDNAIYPWSGSSWSEQIGGTTLGTGALVGTPTNLALLPDQTYATTGTLTWDLVSNAFVRFYEVILRDSSDSVLYERTEYGQEHTVPLLAPGDYTLSVYAVSTTNRRSAEAELAFTLSTPVPPSDLGLVVSNNSIQSEPVLAGLNLGTQFEFDIVEGDGAGHTPEGRIRARTGVFTGLIPSTQYTVFVRTLNALGASAWVSESAVTTANTAELEGVLVNAPSFVGLADRTENAFYELEIDRRNYEGTGTQVIENETSFTLFKWGQINENNAFAYAIEEINVAIGPDGALAQSITAVGVRVDDAEGNIVANADAIDNITARVGYCTLNGEPTGDEDRATCEANGGTWVDDAPLAESIRATRVEIAGGQFATFSQIGQTYQDVDGDLIARGAVLTNVNGQVSGFINTNDGNVSSFDIAADIFRVGVIDGGGAFTPKLSLEDVEGVPTLTLRGRIVLEDGFEVNTESDIQGADGAAGAGQYAGEYSSFVTGQSNITSRFNNVTGRNPVFGDIFTQVRSSDGAVLTRYYDSAQWIEAPLLFVDGNIVALGTIAGNRLISNTTIEGPKFSARPNNPDPSDNVVIIDPAAQNDVILWSGREDSSDVKSRDNAKFFIDSTGEYPRTFLTTDDVIFYIFSSATSANITRSVKTNGVGSRCLITAVARIRSSTSGSEPVEIIIREGDSNGDVIGRGEAVLSDAGTYSIATITAIGEYIIPSGASWGFNKSFYVSTSQDGPSPPTQGPNDFHEIYLRIENILDF